MLVKLICNLKCLNWKHCNSAKNSISASDSSLAENLIKTWAIHTPSLSRCGRLWSPGSTKICLHTKFVFPSPKKFEYEMQYFVQ